MKLNVTKLTRSDLRKLFYVVSYHIAVFDIDYDEELYNQIPKDKRSGHCFEDKIIDLLLNGKEIIVYDKESDGEFYGKMCKHTTETLSTQRWYDGAPIDVSVCAYHVTLETILNGLSKRDAIEYIGEFGKEDDMDEAAAYNLLQCILFGKIVYC